jgi:hypothetical protein
MEGLNMTKFTGFDSLDAVWKYSTQPGAIVYYHAPLDYQPRSVTVYRRFKNGKLRIHAGSLNFTADARHLERFKRVVVGYNTQKEG